VTAFEDPRDELRVWLPARKTVTARVVSGGASVTLAGKTRSGTGFLLSARNRGAGRYTTVVVKPAPGVRDPTYSVAFSAR
jgi:hypothetical protein